MHVYLYMRSFVEAIIAHRASVLLSWRALIEQRPDVGAGCRNACVQYVVDNIKDAYCMSLRSLFRSTPIMPFIISL